MLIESLPASALLPLPQLGLLFVGVVVEKHYVSRVTCFTNSLALAAHVGTQSDPGFWLATYAELGLAAGIVGMWAYLGNRKLPEWYYLIALAMFSAGPVGAVLVFQEQWLLSLVISGTISIVVTASLSGDFRVAHMDSMPGAVYRYAKGRTLQHIDHALGYEAKIDLLEALRNEPP